MTTQDRLRACSRSLQHRLARLRLLRSAVLPPSAWRLGGGPRCSGPKAISAPGRRARRLLLPLALTRTMYPEEWGPFDLPPPEGTAVPDAPPGVFADREPAEPLRPPPAAPAGPQAADYPEDWGPLEEVAPCAFEEQDIWASLITPPPAGAELHRPAGPLPLPRRDPRHTRPRLLHAGGGVEICRHVQPRQMRRAGVRPQQSARLLSVGCRRTRCHMGARLLRAPGPPRSRAPACPACGPPGAEAT